MMITIIFIILALTVIFTTKLSPETVKLRKHYNKFLDAVRTNEIPEKFKVLRTPVIIHTYPSFGEEIGWNLNKGHEIGICKGPLNEMFHVLVHELAHSTVEEYDHSDAFWKNCEELKSLCVEWGLYTYIRKPTLYCKKYIKD